MELPWNPLALGPMNPWYYHGRKKANLSNPRALERKESKALKSKITKIGS